MWNRVVYHSIFAAPSQGYAVPQGAIFQCGDMPVLRLLGCQFPMAVPRAQSTVTLQIQSLSIV